MTPSQANAASLGHRSPINRRDDDRQESAKLVALIEAANNIEPLPMLHEIVEQEAEKYRKELEQ